jgi:hypothetical protein
VARGLYSALGHFTHPAAVVELLARFGAAVGRGDPAPEAALPPSAHAPGAAAVAAIRAFERRVGVRTGAAAEIVSTPDGPAVELGNVSHRGFGHEHEAAARQVARGLAALLTALGATGVLAFTMD